MRSHEQMAADVIKRRNEYLEQKKRRRAMIVRTVTASLGTAAVVLFCFALWNNDLVIDMRPDPDKFPVMVTDTATNAVTEPADTTTSPQTDSRTEPPRTEKTAPAASTAAHGTSGTAASAKTAVTTSAVRTADAPVLTPSHQNVTHPSRSTAPRQMGAVTTAARTATQTKPVSSAIRTDAVKTTVPAVKTTAVPVMTTVRITESPVIIQTTTTKKGSGGEPATINPTAAYTGPATTIVQHTRTLPATENPTVTTVHHTYIIVPVTIAPQTTTVTTTTAPPIITADFVEEFGFDGMTHRVSQQPVDPDDIAELIGTQTIRRNINGSNVTIRAEIYAVKDNDSTKVRAVRFNDSDTYYLCSSGRRL